MEVQKRLSEFTKPIPYLVGQLTWVLYQFSEEKTDAYYRIFKYLTKRYGLCAEDITSCRQYKARFDYDGPYTPKRVKSVNHSKIRR